jgi:hypothetical protein
MRPLCSSPAFIRLAHGARHIVIAACRSIAPQGRPATSDRALAFGLIASPLGAVDVFATRAAVQFLGGLERVGRLEPFGVGEYRVALRTLPASFVVAAWGRFCRRWVHFLALHAVEIASSHL